MKTLRRRLARVGLGAVRLVGLGARGLLLGLAYLGRDLHISPGLLLLGWGLWHSPAPWAAGVVVGLLLWYMGVFRLANRGKPSDGDIRHPRGTG